MWNYALELCRGLRQADVAVSFAAMGRRLSTAEQAVARSIAADVFESEFKLEWMQDPWCEVAAAGEWLLDLESRAQPSVVHLNGYVHGALRWQAPCLIVGHSCVCVLVVRIGLAHSAIGGCACLQEAVIAGLQAANLVTAAIRTAIRPRGVNRPGTLRRRGDDTGNVFRGIP